MTYLGRRPAALAIRAYRRFASGRGPLRRVCCTFAHTESCSAYGLRAVEEVATSLPHALRLVRARIQACRRTSIYRFSSGLGWERAHELAPAELAAQLARRGERADTIAQVIAARMTVAKWRGERAIYARVRAARPIPVRAGDAAIARYRRLVRRNLAVAIVAALAMLLHVAAIVPCILALLATVNARAAADRLDQQRVAAKFLRPATS